MRIIVHYSFHFYISFAFFPSIFPSSVCIPVLSQIPQTSLRFFFPQHWSRTGSKPPHTTVAGFIPLWPTTNQVLWSPAASFLHIPYETGLVLLYSELWHSSRSIIKASRLLCWSYLFMPLQHLKVYNIQCILVQEAKKQINPADAHFKIVSYKRPRKYLEGNGVQQASHRFLQKHTRSVCY